MGSLQNIEKKIECKEFRQYDSEDIAGVLSEIERSFKIKLVDEELQQLNTFGELCDYIKSKIALRHADDCTSQQAFYKLRDAIAATWATNYKEITPEARIELFIPREIRRQRARQFYNHLGFKINFLSPPTWITITLVLICLSSFVALFFNWRIGLPGMLFAFIGFWIADIFANEPYPKLCGNLLRR